jgi:ribose-phosphate pyrophosphokinase
MKESILFSLDGRTSLASSIVKSANAWASNKTLLGQINKQKFSDGEVCVDFTDSVRGKRVYLLSSPNTSDEIMRLMTAIDAAKRAAAVEIIPILPYFPYARQDKKDQSRGPIGAKMMADMLSAVGATSIITYDLHADQIQGFFNIPVTHIEGKNVFDEYISEIANENIILCGPDAGSGKRVKRMRDQIAKKYGINLSYVMMDKTRKEANVISEMEIIGDVTGKDVIILDDMVDTAGTLCKAAEVLKNAGATSVRAIISHGVLSGRAYENIGTSKLIELVISDSLEKADPVWLCSRENYNEEICTHIRFGSNKTKVISTSEQFGFAVAAINDAESYETLKSRKKQKESV